MKSTHDLNGIAFEWDSQKAEANRRKHSVDFESACEAFFDPFVRPAEAGDESSEERLALIGMTTAWELLFVVYIERGDGLRIISARSVTPRERRSYEDL